MKKILLSALAVLAAMSVNAQEIGRLDGAAVGLSSDASAVTAGTVLATTESVTCSVLYDDNFKSTGFGEGYAFTVNGTDFSVSGLGVQGSTNVGSTAASAGTYPTTGCIYRFVPTKDGYLYVLHKGSNNKNYVVWEEEARVSYYFSMEDGGQSSTVYDFELKNIEGATTYDEELATYFVNADYAILQPKEYVTSFTGSGASIIKFPVFANCKYDVHATGSKLTLVAFFFSENDDVTVTTGTATLYAPGTSGISNVTVNNAEDANAPYYNLQGQRVNKDAKGILIQNGKKFINK